MNTSEVKQRSIEIIVGLPHLSAGKLLERARALQQPVLVSANAFSRWSLRQGWRDWSGWSTRVLGNATGLHSLCLDSAGFSAMTCLGGYPWTIDKYVSLAACHPFRWWASLDYCVEQEITGDRDEVVDRISRTIRANIDCRQRAEDRGIAATFMPVIQGRLPSDYERCADAMPAIIERAGLIGVGSMCRRAIHGPEGMIAVVDHLDRVLPPRLRLHLFGVKGQALPYLIPFSHRVASIDSQAYGVAARAAARRQGRSKSDLMVADCMEHWVRVQRDRLRQRPRRLTQPSPAVEPSGPRDPWACAMAEARRQMRELIESGDLDHDETTIGWIEQWAADLYQD
ncbi:DUF7221 family queuine tRNA-ribosyltransferase-like protein [Sphingobium baderi]|uniref:DeoxyPurine in DNA protein A domain-containing protein n=1 Tax=Sphingobium baderi LL03 TaxID=1114964 RepID=T0I0D8_9SPHN|nr:hypothetical protein [Sphingobium baderi]EQB05100.1 hypothetical protein L485_03000 [Sphingobium baderi LL03]KMS60102.1 hypothetical protein V475_19745 [Sphingobium baderi LL03]